MNASKQSASNCAASSRPALRVPVLAVLACLSLALSGCQYSQNRMYDFCDIFQFGAGVTSQNPESGMAPPSIGVYAQVSDFINLGALYFNGLTAEMDGRGFYAGPEERMRFGLGPYQAVKIDQKYLAGASSYFKQPKSLWAKRLDSPAMRFKKTPAKSLNYEKFTDEIKEGYPVMHRGWQYWENISLELALSEPFLSHLGFDLRIGFDPSEISDLILGIFGIDYNNDDMNDAEFNELDGAVSPSMAPAPMPAEK